MGSVTNIRYVTTVTTITIINILIALLPEGWLVLASLRYEAAMRRTKLLDCWSSHAVRLETIWSR